MCFIIGPAVHVYNGGNVAQHIRSSSREYNNIIIYHYILYKRIARLVAACAYAITIRLNCSVLLQQEPSVCASEKTDTVDACSGLCIISLCSGGETGAKAGREERRKEKEKIQKIIRTGVK